MKKILLTAFFAITLSANLFAQNNTFFQTIAGKWEGTLEYSDYTSNKRVKLKTVIEVKPSADGLSAEILTTYDDFGKIIKSANNQRIDLKNKKFFDGDTEFSMLISKKGQIILLGKTQDGDNLQPTRKTIDFNKDTLTILKETRTPWKFRNVYVFKRVSRD